MKQQLVIITGMSGSGKSLAVRVFEDMGYYCVDNLPIRLIPTFMDLIGRQAPDFRKVALVIDIREGAFLSEVPDILDGLKRLDLERKVIFFEASDDILKRRFSETRRPHPLAGEGSLEEGILREREALARIRERADVIIDSSGFNVHELREHLSDQFSPQGQGATPLVSVTSFGYKFGIPPEADLLFDARFLPNPYFVESLKEKTGLDEEVAAYLDGFEDYREFLGMIVRMLEFLLPRYAREGKSYLTIGIGCTGGRHRSVGLAERIGATLARNRSRVKISHRDLRRSQGD